MTGQTGQYWGINCTPPGGCITYESANIHQFFYPVSPTPPDENVAFPSVVNAGDLLLLWSRGINSDNFSDLNYPFTPVLFIGFPLHGLFGYRIADGTEGGNDLACPLFPDSSGFDWEVPSTIAIIHYSAATVDAIVSVGLTDFDYDFYYAGASPLDLEVDAVAGNLMRSFILVGEKNPNGNVPDDPEVYANFSSSTPTVTNRDSAGLEGTYASFAVTYPSTQLWNTFSVADQLDVDTVATLPVDHAVFSFSQTGDTFAAILAVMEVVCEVGDGGGGGPTVPDAPILSIDCVDGTENDLSWTDTDGDTYTLQRSPYGYTSFSDLTTTAGLSYNDTGLDGSYHAYRVKATNGTGDSAWSNTVAAGQLPAPGLNVTDNGDGDSLHVGVFGMVDPGVDEIIVERFNGSTWDIVFVYSPPSPGGTRETDDTGLTVDTEYCYRAIVHGHGCLSDSDYTSDQCATVTLITYNPCSDPAPGNDDFADALEITGASGDSGQICVTNATIEGSEPTGSDLGNGIHQTIWFFFVAPADGHLTLDTHGSLGGDSGSSGSSSPPELDTTLAAWTGTNFGDLVEVASNDDSTNLTSAIDFDVSNGVTYWIQAGAFDEPYNGSILLNWSFA